MLTGFNLNYNFNRNNIVDWVCQNQHFIKQLTIKHYLSTCKLLNKKDVQTNPFSFIVKHLWEFISAFRQ
jgi:hypothetical protein